jgi:hypothetical protein
VENACAGFVTNIVIALNEAGRRDWHLFKLAHKAIHEKRES